MLHAVMGAAYALQETVDSCMEELAGVRLPPQHGWR